MKRKGTSLLAVTTKKCSISHPEEIFPEEILFDILSRSSIKDLSRFRSVSKDWNKFITDPFFVNLHHSRINQDQQGSNFLIQCYTRQCCSHLYLVDYENRDRKKAFNINFNLPCKKTKMVGSSNGLLCLCSLPDHETYYICNPLTREVLQLPRACGLDTYREKKIKCCPTPSGFGFDTTTNTYKVVHTWYFADEIHGKSVFMTGVEIYTIGSGKWRRLEDIPTRLFYPPETSQALVNGVLHWNIWCRTDSEFNNYICAIDIRSESFRFFKKPYRWSFTLKQTLEVLNGSLCLMDVEKNNGNILLWIKKDDGGMRDSWTPDYIVKNNTLGPLTRLQITSPFKILKTWKQQSLLFHCEKDQGYYDLDTKKLEHALIDGLPKRSSGQVEAVVHLGSLISPTSLDATIPQTSTKIPRRTRPKRKLNKSR